MFRFQIEINYRQVSEVLGGGLSEYSAVFSRLFGLSKILKNLTKVFAVAADT